MKRELTVRQIQVLRLIARGKCDKEIADELGVKVSTILDHVQKIMPKLKARSRPHAVYIFFAR